VGAVVVPVLAAARWVLAAECRGVVADMGAQRRALRRCRDQRLHRLVVRVAVWHPAEIAWQLRAQPTAISRRRAVNEAQA